MLLYFSIQKKEEQKEEEEKEQKILLLVIGSKKMHVKGNVLIPQSSTFEATALYLSVSQSTTQRSKGQSKVASLSSLPSWGAHTLCVNKYLKHGAFKMQGMITGRLQPKLQTLALFWFQKFVFVSQTT